jgi:hypothetical protein
MGKILEFGKKRRKLAQAGQLQVSPEHLEDEISAVANDHSLPPAQRRWLLENLLMDMDEQLEAYKREMELAEREMEATVRASEREIEAAYREYLARLEQLTRSVQNLPRRNGRQRH